MNHDDESAALAHQQQLENEQMNKLSAALVKAQAEMLAASKDAKNPHFKSTYSSLAAVIDAVRPPLAANGLGFIQKLHTADGGISVETVLVHESGEHLSCGVLFIPASKHDAQGFGSAISYGKRYSLQAALGVSSEDDDGDAASKSKPDSGYNKGLAQAAMKGCETLKDLQDTFAVYYKMAPAGQKAVLKESYDNLKSKFNSTEEK